MTEFEPDDDDGYEISYQAYTILTNVVWGLLAAIVALGWFYPMVASVALTLIFLLDIWQSYKENSDGSVPPA